MQEYLQNKQYFADLFNGCFFHGRPVICASELTEASEGYVVDQDNTITSEKTLAAVKVKKDGNEEQFQCSVDRTLDQATVSDAAGTEIQIEKSRPRTGRRRDTKTKLMRDVKMQLRSGTVLPGSKVGCNHFFISMFCLHNLIKIRISSCSRYRSCHICFTFKLFCYKLLNVLDCS